VPAVLDGALEAVVVDPDDAEPLAEAVAPFEVVEQRPDEVTAHVDAALHGAMHGRDVPAEVVDALRIVDGAVDHDVVERRAVLGDDERQLRELLVHVEQELLESVRRDVPAHLRVRAVLRQELHGVRPGPRRAGGRLVTVGCRACARAVPELHRGGRVVVHAEEVDRLVDELEVAVPDERPVGDALGVLEQVGRVCAVQQRAGECPVREGVDLAHRLGAALADSAQRVQVERDGELRIVANDPPQFGERESVGEVQVVNRGERIRPVGAARGVRAGAVAEVGGAPRLVEGRPGRDAIAEGLADHGRVLGEAVRRVAVRPAAGILERLRQVPVVQGGDGRDPASEESVNELRVEVDAGLVDRAGSGGDDARPGDREAVGLQAEALHQVEVRLEQVIVAVRHVAGRAVADQPRRVREGVPDRRAATILVPGAFDLVCRGRRAEEEVLRKDEAGVAIVGIA
jgi:hypothetical protein